MSEDIAHNISISVENHEETTWSQPKKSFYDTVIGKILIKMAYIIPILWSTNKLTTDPLFLYDYLIDDERKCIVLASWFDPLVAYLLPLDFALDVASLCSLVIKGGLLKTNEKLIWLPLLLIQFFSYGYFNIPKLEEFNKFIWPNTYHKNYYVVNFYLIHYFGTVILMYIAFTRIATDRFAKSTWTKAAFNLLLYMYGGYVFGSLWYFSAVRRNLDCWIGACKLTNQPCTTFDDLYCDTNQDYSHRILDEKCSTTPSNGGDFNFDFGIYKDAIQSGIVLQHHYIWIKILHCLQWGLQNLSGFGQNLTTAVDPWENVFVIYITIYGMMLFTFFIGNIQMYLQETVKSRSNKKLEIQKSNVFPKLSENLRKQIKKGKPEKIREVKFDQLSSNIKNRIKRELCYDILFKVDVFKCWRKELLMELCDYAKTISYPEHAQILKENDSIDKMLLILQGKLRVYSFVSSDVKVDEIEDGGICGDELVNWFGRDPNASSLPTSTKTIEAITRVDAFVLMDYDIKTLFIKHQKVNRSNTTPPN